MPRSHEVDRISGTHVPHTWGDIVEPGGPCSPASPCQRPCDIRAESPFNGFGQARQQHLLRGLGAVSTRPPIALIRWDQEQAGRGSSSTNGRNHGQPRSSRLSLRSFQRHPAYRSVAKLRRSTSGPTYLVANHVKEPV